jgi:large subunit ribosomal protein L3e
MATTESANPKQTYSGGCHCGFVRYTADLDAANLKLTKCNCSMCHKKGYVNITVQPEDFKLFSPPSMDDQGDYQFGSKSVHHYFCKTCGISSMMVGSYEFEGSKVSFQSINALTLDQDQGIDLAKMKPKYFNGKTNDWAQVRDEPYPGGSW